MRTLHGGMDEMAGMSGTPSGTATEAAAPSASNFCSGSGTVMQNGFVNSFSSKGSCLLWLFQDTLLNTRGRYAGAIIGTFLLAVFAEALRYGRALALQERFPFHNIHKAHPALREGGLALAYGVQMMVGYWLMMLTMTYDPVLFSFILVGLVTGYFIFSRLDGGLIRAPAKSCNCSTTAVHGELLKDDRQHMQNAVPADIVPLKQVAISDGVPAQRSCCQSNNV